MENYGVDPDQVVEFPPQAWGAGEDPQLAAGIGYLLAELERRPARPMPGSGHPAGSRRAPELPPRPADAGVAGLGLVRRWPAACPARMG